MRIRGGVVKLVGTVCWLLFAVVFLGLFMGGEGGFKLGRQAAWRPRCNRGGVVKKVGGTVQFAEKLSGWRSFFYSIWANSVVILHRFDKCPWVPASSRLSSWYSSCGDKLRHSVRPKISQVYSSGAERSIVTVNPLRIS